MNLKLLPSILAFCSIAIFSACANDNKPAEKAATETTAAENATPALPADAAAIDAPPVGDVTVIGTPTAPATAISPTPAPTAAKSEPPQNAAGVWHYTCPKGCKGGGGAAAPCAKCGTALAHNAAYHPAAPTPASAPKQDISAAVKPAAAPEPPQNKTGVWHYTCPDGCAGGGGAATPCAKCGKTLAHNAVYHQ